MCIIINKYLLSILLNKRKIKTIEEDKMKDVTIKIINKIDQH